MKIPTFHFIILSLLGLLFSCNSNKKKEPADKMEQIETPQEKTTEANNTKKAVDPVTADTIEVGKVEKTGAEWKASLGQAEFHILREAGTEPAFENEYYNNKTEGIYACAACGLPLYSSNTKFHSGTGWPSFWAPIDPKLVERKPDRRFEMVRTEVVCAQCGSHLGHIFENPTVPSGERHCLNSAALDFKAMEL